MTNRSSVIVGIGIGTVLALYYLVHASGWLIAVAIWLTATILIVLRRRKCR